MGLLGVLLPAVCCFFLIQVVLFGWNGVDFGYGVVTTLKIVGWPTAFLSQAAGIPSFGSAGLFHMKELYNISSVKFFSSLLIVMTDDDSYTPQWGSIKTME